MLDISGVCVAAIHSGVSGERGGAFVIVVDRNREKAQYPGVEGFLISSSEAPAGLGYERRVLSLGSRYYLLSNIFRCGVVAAAVNGMPPGGLHDVQVMDTQTVLESRGSPLYSGMYSIPASMERAIVAR